MIEAKLQPAVQSARISIMHVYVSLAMLAVSGAILMSSYVSSAKVGYDYSVSLGRSADFAGSAELRTGTSTVKIARSNTKPTRIGSGDRRQVIATFISPGAVKQPFSEVFLSGRWVAVNRYHVGTSWAETMQTMSPTQIESRPVGSFLQEHDNGGTSATSIVSGDRPFTHDL